MRSTPTRALHVATALGVGSLGMLCVSSAATAGASARGDRAFEVTQVLLGASLTHTFTPQGATTPRSEALSDPDDISRLGDDLFVGFQNGVGPQGQASRDGNLDSTVVELTLSGKPIGQWDVVGKADGVTADPATGLVIATVNEDANSALYTINPTVPSSATRYTYNEPLPHAAELTPSRSTRVSCSSVPRHPARLVWQPRSRRTLRSTRWRSTRAPRWRRSYHSSTTKIRPPLPT